MMATRSKSAGSSRSPSANGRASKRTTAPIADPRTLRESTVSELPFPSLSFITKQSGREPECCWFDVPAEDYGPGNVTGMKAFAAYMAALKSGVTFWQLGVLQEVSKALGECPGGRGPSRRGAAVGFLSMMEQTLQLAATQTNHQTLISFHVGRLQHSLACEELQKKQWINDFATRMRAAKAAKRQAAATVSGGAL